MGLFSGKVERVLNKCLKKSLFLHVRYADGMQDHPSKIIRMGRDDLVIHGFQHSLREEAFSIQIQELGVSFETNVTHTTEDLKGKTLYHCTMPTKLNGVMRPEMRFLIYPKGEALLLTDVAGTDALQMSIWDMTPKTIELVNQTEQQFPVGFQFASCKIQIDKTTAMVHLEVKYHGSKQHKKRDLPILGCSFLNPPANMEEIMEACKRVDSL